MSSPSEVQEKLNKLMRNGRDKIKINGYRKGKVVIIAKFTKICFGYRLEVTKVKNGNEKDFDVSKGVIERLWKKYELEKFKILE